MKPVDQTTYGEQGNCYSAAVASLLELPLAEVPYFMGPGDWWGRFVEWCAGRGWFPIFLPVAEIPHPPAGYSLMSGHVARGPRLHTVIALDGVMVHDPNEPAGRPGLTEVTDFIILVPLAS